MNCEACWQALGPYLDDELPPLERLATDQHLHTCPPCRRLVRSCQQTIRAYREFPPPELPAALHQQVMSRVNHQRPAK